MVYKEDYRKPVLGPDDVLIKVHYCGICGSDVSNFKYKLYLPPLIMGHEFSGEIVELGENVTNFKINNRVIGINVSLETFGKNMTGIGIIEDGGFAEYVKVQQKDVFLIPDSISNLHAAMIESFANSMRAIKMSKVDYDSNIVIVGGGNIGLCTLVSLIQERNPKSILVIEPHEFLRKKAIEFGADNALPPNKVKINRFLKNQGKPLWIFDCAGTERSLNLSMNLIKKGGTILLEGIHRGTINFPVMIMNSKEICLKGCLGHDKEDILKSIELFEKKKVDAGKFISGVFPLKKIQEIFEKFLEPGERNFIKLIIEI
ncbi:MAG: zinc-dependent alcohol dehydrogenase [Promethearchaeota archaeon]